MPTSCITSDIVFPSYGNFPKKLNNELNPIYNIYNDKFYSSENLPVNLQFTYVIKIVLNDFFYSSENLPVNRQSTYVIKKVLDDFSYF